MKIVINKCYGGFGLSYEAIDWLWKNGVKEVGFDAIEYYGGPKMKKNKDKVKEVCDRLDKRIPKWREDLERDLAAWRNRKISQPGSNYVRSQFSDDGKYVLYAGRELPRDHPKLIECIEKFKEKANGEYAKLAVVEVPDGADWEIDEYDGVESIHEKHRSWS